MTIRNTIFILGIIVSALTSSCNLLDKTPEKVFDTVALNANKIPKDFTRNFKELRQQKANGSLQMPAEDGKSMRKVDCSEFVAYMYTKTFEADVENVQKLSVNEETKPIIDAALDMYRYADEIYKNDFPAIASMIDAEKPEEEIDAAIQQLNDTKAAELYKKYETTMRLVIPYADKHGVEYKTMNIPWK